MPRRISKSELQQQIEEISLTISGTALPDDYGQLRPPDETEAPDIMRRQIELVNGGPSRLNRAKLAHWRSRNQRQRWLEDDVAIATRLNEFDQALIDAWADRHGPMVDDTVSSGEEQKQRQGCSLLDWSHNEAPQRLFRIGKRTVPPYLTQGTFQDLADTLKVGWHPEYKERLSTAGNGSEIHQHRHVRDEQPRPYKYLVMAIR